MSSVQSFESWWNTIGSWVEQPNERRGGKSGVQILHPKSSDKSTLYSKRQIGHDFRSLRYPGARPTAFREKQALERLPQLGINVPELVYYGAEKKAGVWHAILVTKALDGFISLDDWYKQNIPSQVGQQLHLKLLKAIASMLARLHKAGWQHNCCYSNHIFVRVDVDNQSVDCALLDLEKARRRWAGKRAAKSDMKQLKRHRGLMPNSDWELLLSHYQQCNSKVTF
ncbi:lipopolysaccharide kinase InaA family protein [Pseudomonas sp. F1_0610]|uniref:lipopolysaccharide kinase InaA family protein n=1 Tax=Pseudomonas sp. F1_0610 TaxID=3114284 RepID=UPI0039C20DAC